MLPLIAGYLYVSDCKQVKYKHSREDGHRLYFRIAYFGLLLAFFPACVLALVDATCGEMTAFQQARDRLVDIAQPLLKDKAAAPAQVAFVLVCLGSVVLGRLLPTVDNLIFKVKAEQAAYDAAATDDLELLLLEAAVQYKSISVTTSSGKAYVGLVLQTGEPKTDRRVIALLPFMSGYRNDSGRIVFTTFYDEIYQQRAAEREDDESNDFRLILPIDKLVSVAFFDMKVYEAFSTQERSAAPRRIKVHAPARERVS